jgi:hypothetical protein
MIEVLEWCGRHPWLTLLFVLLVRSAIKRTIRLIAVAIRGYPPPTPIVLDEKVKKARIPTVEAPAC